MTLLKLVVVAYALQITSLGVVDLVDVVELKLGAVINPFSNIETMSSTRVFGDLSLRVLLRGSGGREDEREDVVSICRLRFLNEEGIVGAVLAPVEDDLE
jgi:hypothetical protein